MIENYCRMIYNIGLKLDCSLSSINCLCPDKDSYEYLCYQCYLKLKDITNGEYRLKYDDESGSIAIDHCFTCETECLSVDWSGFHLISIVAGNAKAEINKWSRLSERHMRFIVERVALAMTQTAVFRYREITYADIIDALDTEQFINHCWNLLYAIMRKFQNGQNCEKLLMKLTQYINNVNEIYEKREEIGNQYQEYLNLICVGLEGTKQCLYMAEVSLWQWGKLIENKKGSRSLEEFIFCCIDTDGTIMDYMSQSDRKDDFLAACGVLRNYLLSYPKLKKLMAADIYEKAIMSLEAFGVQGLDISSVKGLERLNLQAANSGRANADIIVEYLKKIRRRNMIAVWGK